MGYSAFDPVALADTRSVKNKIDVGGITSDVLAVGDVIRYDPETDTYMKAQANNDVNANFIGVVESVDGTSITVVYSGEISLPDTVMSLVAGYTGAQVFYLSDTQEGKLTTTAPSSPASIIKPVIISMGTVQDGIPSGAQGTVDGIVVNSLGTKISGDSTVDLSDIQPVGSVLAFAGKTGDIPAGWDICDGGYLSTTTYSDLYGALNYGKLYGFKQLVNLQKVTASGSGIVNINNLIGSQFLVTRAGLSDSFRCTVLSGTVSGTSITSAVVEVDPNYVNGGYHDSELQNGDLCRFYIDGEIFDAVYSVTNTPAKTEFKKPDLRARFIIGSSRGYTGQENTAFSTYTVGQFGGEEFHTLLANEMPIHAHGITWTLELAGSVGATHDLYTEESGAHTHLGRPFSNGRDPNNSANGVGIRGDLQPGDPPPTNESSNITTEAGSHVHNIRGNIYVSATDLLPTFDFGVQNAGANLAHNNVPQHIVMYWIIKTRKDSYAKIYKLGPSGGGAIVARNTAKRWVRATSGTGCTTDIGYGTWGISRASQGNYVFTHDMLTDLGATGATQYIVEATVTKSGSGLTQMFVANPYNLGGVTFGVMIYDIIGATHSDNFQYLNLTLYGGGTAL
jgi:microcystin-dependent protein